VPRRTDTPFPFTLGGRRSPKPGRRLAQLSYLPRACPAPGQVPFEQCPIAVGDSIKHVGADQCVRLRVWRFIALPPFAACPMYGRGRLRGHISPVAGEAYLPLSTTAHKQGRGAGECYAGREAGARQA
jgi:hypothetical protein